MYVGVNVGARGGGENHRRSFDFAKKRIQTVRIGSDLNERAVAPFYIHRVVGGITTARELQPPMSRLQLLLSLIFLPEPLIPLPLFIAGRNTFPEAVACVFN